MFVVVDSAAAGQPADRIDFGRSLKRGRDKYMNSRTRIPGLTSRYKRWIKNSAYGELNGGGLSGDDDADRCQPHTRAPHAIRETGTAASLA